MLVDETDKACLMYPGHNHGCQVEGRNFFPYFFFHLKRHMFGLLMHPTTYFPTLTWFADFNRQPQKILNKFLLKSVHFSTSVDAVGD